MNFGAIRFAIVTSCRITTPPCLLPSPTTNYLRLQPSTSGVRLCSGASSIQPTHHHDNHSDMDDVKKTQDQDESDLKVKDRDVMSHSFGDGYSTRSDEEGFGGIYGGNQPGFIKHDDEIHDDHPEYDKSQGSEVKEKETARNQTCAKT